MYFRQTMDHPLKVTVYSRYSELLRVGKLQRNMGSDLIASRKLACHRLVHNISAQCR